MSTTLTNAAQAKKAELTKGAKDFRANATGIANMFLKDWVGEERAREATGRIATALSASAAAARDPSDFYACTPASVAKVIAISALTGIMVSTGQGALAYAIPRRPRKNEDPQLQYQLSHRGIAALAKRAGLSLVAYPISVRDAIETDECGEVVVMYRDIDNPPQTEADLRGVMVLVRTQQTGIVLSRGFVAKTIINSRRAQSDSYNYAERKGNEWAKDSDPWHKWYVEMAIKTAMHYAIGRGWCVIDDTEALRALQVDAEADYKQISVGLDEDPRTATQRLEEQILGGDAPADDTKQASDPQDQ